MKQVRRSIPSSFYTAFFLFLIYIFVVIVSFILASEGSPGIFSGELFTSSRGLIVLVIIPILLLVFLGFFLFGIVSDSLHRQGSNRVRMRFFASMCLILILSSVPQSAIIGCFVSSSLGTCFDRPVQESLKAAEEIAGIYIAERQHIMETVGKRFFNGLAIVNYRVRPSDWMNDIRIIDNGAAACQIYQMQEKNSEAIWTPVMEIGDSARFFPRDRLESVRDGILEITPEEEILRYGQIVRYSNSVFVCIYTSALPSGFRTRQNTVQAAYSQARVIETLTPWLPFLGGWIFILFCLPVLVISFILAWYMSDRISEPILALEDAVVRLVEGDTSFMLVPHSRDELAETAVLINRLAEQIEASKVAEKKSVPGV